MHYEFLIECGNLFSLEIMVFNAIQKMRMLCRLDGLSETLQMQQMQDSL